MRCPTPWLFILACASCGSGSTFDESECLFHLDVTQTTASLGSDSRLTARCGRIIVPENRSHPVRNVVIPVVAFKGRNPEAPAVIYLDGGPGQSWANLGLDTLSAQDTAGLENDFVVIEQRGAGLSVPALECGGQRVGQSDAAYVRSCAAEFTRQGIDLSAYNILELAEDVADLVHLLGYKKVILVGTSYGTAWAQQIMRAHSELLAGVVLDSVVSPLTPPLASGAEVTDQAFTQLFAETGTQFGDLEQKMLVSLASLQVHPLSGDGGMTAATFFSDSRSLLESSPLYAPAFIDLVYRSTLLGSLTFDNNLPRPTTEDLSGDISFGQYLSVICSDDQIATSATATTAAALVRPAFAPYLGSTAKLLAACAAWPYLKRETHSFSLVGSVVPTLLLSGEVDPLTSRQWAMQVASALPNSTLISVPGVGHDVAASGLPCVTAALSAFLAKPGQVTNNCAAITPTFMPANTFGRDRTQLLASAPPAFWPIARAHHRPR